MAGAFSLIATIVTFVFAGAVLRQYLQRQRLYRLVWAVALLCYGVATAVQFAAELHGWTTTSFRLWYLSGGLLTAAYLGQGTACLLLAPRVAWTLLAILLIATAWAMVRALTVPLSLASVLPPSGQLTPPARNLPADLRWLAGLLNVYGTLLLVGGAIWSALVFWDRMLDKRRRAGHRVIATLFIAAGSGVVAAAGSLESLGHGEYLYAAETIGIITIFAGFLRTRETVPLPRPRFRRQPAPAPDSGSSIEVPPPAQPVRSLRRVADRTPTPRR